jgi:hypothetical protein
MTRLALVAALSTALVGASAFAQTASMPADPSPAPGGAAPQGEAALAQVLERFDTDDDQKISLMEWTAAGRQERGFTRFDTDADGFIVESELRAALAMMAQMRAQRAQ